MPKITLGEMKELIKENSIPPKQLFTEKEILEDPEVKEYIEAERGKAIKEKKEKEDDFIPDAESTGKSGGDDSLIPD